MRRRGQSILFQLYRSDIIHTFADVHNAYMNMHVCIRRLCKKRVRACHVRGGRGTDRYLSGMLLLKSMLSYWLDSVAASGVGPARWAREAAW